MERLHRAGAVLVAKLSLGALALNDIWFGGRDEEPVAARGGLGRQQRRARLGDRRRVRGFRDRERDARARIVDPSMRCGVTGLRPTFGRVARTGAMTLCWSMDKLGPMARGVEDTLLVLAAITGPDPGDVSSVPSRLDFEADGAVAGLRVGYFPPWMKESPATDVDRAALETVRRARDGAGRGEPAGLALRLVEHDPLRRSGGRVRGADAFRRPRPAQDAGAGRLAEHVPAVAVSLGGRLRAGRPAAAKGRAGDGADLLDGRPPPRPVAPRRDPHDHELHGPPLAHAARRASSRSIRRAATGRRIRRARCRGSRRSGASRTA